MGERAIANINESTGAPPRLRRELNLGTAWLLPEWSSGPPSDMQAMHDAAAAAGYTAIQGGDITICAELGLPTTRVDGRSGVWVRGEGGAQDRKVAAIGVRVAQGVTMHGFALNCDCDLGWFTRIVACGLPDAGVTSLSAELGRPVTVADAVPLVEARLDSLVRPRTAPAPTPAGRALAGADIG